jgi:NDP-sugar pyrophosphorylase family protein
MVRDLLGDGREFGVSIQYSFDGSVLRGTAGAIRQALPLLDEAFFVLYGDSYLPCDYDAIEDAFGRSGMPALMTVFRNEDQWDCSNVEFRDGSIFAYDKRNRTPRMHYIDYGLGVFHRRAFEALAPGTVYDLAELYHDLLARDELAAFEVTERFYEIGSVEGIRELSEMLNGQSERNP